MLVHCKKLYIYQEIVVKPGNFVEDMFYIDKYLNIYRYEF